VIILPTYNTYEDETGCSKKSVLKIEMPGNQPKEIIEQKETRGIVGWKDL
jgi:hypothetical protein